MFDELRSEWEALVGRDRVAELQDALTRLLGTADGSILDRCTAQ